ncbi:MAG: hypothetical protein ACHQ2Z_15230, partial [Elusimicrobiota bacterium]
MILRPRAGRFVSAALSPLIALSSLLGAVPVRAQVASAPHALGLGLSVVPSAIIAAPAPLAAAPSALALVAPALASISASAPPLAAVPAGA